MPSRHPNSFLVLEHWVRALLPTMEATEENAFSSSPWQPEHRHITWAMPIGYPQTDLSKECKPRSLASPPPPSQCLPHSPVLWDQDQPHPLPYSACPTFAILLPIMLCQPQNIWSSCGLCGLVLFPQDSHLPFHVKVRTEHPHMHSTK